MLIRLLAGHAFREINQIGVFHSSRRLSSVKMDEPALNSLIKQRVEEAVTNVQTDMLKHMDRIIANCFDTFQRSVKENQRE